MVISYSDSGMALNVLGVTSMSLVFPLDNRLGLTPSVQHDVTIDSSDKRRFRFSTWMRVSRFEGTSVALTLTKSEWTHRKLLYLIEDNYWKSIWTYEVSLSLATESEVGFNTQQFIPLLQSTARNDLSCPIHLPETLLDIVLRDTFTEFQIQMTQWGKPLTQFVTEGRVVAR